MLKNILKEYFEDELMLTIVKHILDNKGVYKFMDYLEQVKDNNYSVLQIIELGFIWNNTPEGYEYWNDIYKKIHYGTWQKRN